MSEPALEVKGIRWSVAAGLDPQGVAPRIEAALAALDAGAKDLKHGRRKSLYRLDLAGRGEPDHLVKVNRYTGNRRRRSKALHELGLATALDARGLPAPVPLAAGERRESGGVVACYLLVEILPRVRDLRETLDDGLPPSRHRALARALGTLGRQLHDAGFHQDDFQPNNFLVRWNDEAPELFVIDFERARLRRKVPDRLRHRALAKLDREMGRAPASRRMHFLRAYCAGDRKDLRRRWRGIADEAVALARRDAGHLFRNATLPGRRFEAVRFAEFSGLALPSIDVQQLEPRVAQAFLDEARIRGTADSPVWTVRVGRPGVRPARKALALALVLAARDLAPRPLAVLCGPTDSLLVLERREKTLQGDEVRVNASVEAAWRVLERRLAAYGVCNRGLTPVDLALQPAGPGRIQARLLANDLFAVRPRFGARGGSAGRFR